MVRAKLELGSGVIAFWKGWALEQQSLRRHPQAVESDGEDAEVVPEGVAEMGVDDVGECANEDGEARSEAEFGDPELMEILQGIPKSDKDGRCVMTCALAQRKLRECNLSVLKMELRAKLATHKSSCFASADTMA